jgi:galactokinase
MILHNIINEEKSYLNGEPRVFFSPGRVNLIGEHIDYLGGRVFPTAINLGTYAIVTPREDTDFHFLSYNFKLNGTKIVSLDHLDYQKDRNWANYPAGMIEAFVAKGLRINHGLNIIIYGTLPNGAGLSSSASLEVLIGVVLRDMYQFDIPMIDIVQIAQRVHSSN